MLPLVAPAAEPLSESLLVPFERPPPFSLFVDAAAVLPPAPAPAAASLAAALAELRLFTLVLDELSSFWLLCNLY